MTWEHSYTPEAYDIARQRLESWPREKLIAALTDYNWQLWQGCDHEHSGLDHYKRPYHKGPRTVQQAIKRFKWDTLALDLLVDAAMECIETTRLCTNGGHGMYIDPSGDYIVWLSD